MHYFREFKGSKNNKKQAHPYHKPPRWNKHYVFQLRRVLYLCVPNVIKIANILLLTPNYFLVPVERGVICEGVTLHWRTTGAAFPCWLCWHWKKKYPVFKFCLFLRTKCYTQMTKCGIDHFLLSFQNPLHTYLRPQQFRGKYIVLETLFFVFFRLVPKVKDNNYVHNYVRLYFCVMLKSKWWTSSGYR